MTKQTSRSAEQAPEELPAQAQAEATHLGEARPQELGAEEIGMTAEAAMDAVPVMTPPGEIEALSYEAGYSAWQNGRKITALWSINQTRNSWANVTGIGWRRLSNKCDSGCVALSMLAAHAKQIQSTVNCREEADKMIHEMYAW
jgi:hypothetical protein